MFERSDFQSGPTYFFFLGKNGLQDESKSTLPTLWGMKKSEWGRTMIEVISWGCNLLRAGSVRSSPVTSELTGSRWWRDCCFPCLCVSLSSHKVANRANNSDLLGFQPRSFAAAAQVGFILASFGLSSELFYWLTTPAPSRGNNSFQTFWIWSH